MRLIMAHCYVGIFSPRGLESFLPETEHAMPFLLRRAYRRGPPASICYWVVAEEDVARQVQRQIADRQRHDAYHTLRTQAREFGTILPPDFGDEF